MYCLFGCECLNQLVVDKIFVFSFFSLFLSDVLVAGNSEQAESNQQCDRHVDWYHWRQGREACWERKSQGWSKNCQGKDRHARNDWVFMSPLTFLLPPVECLWGPVIIAAMSKQDWFIAVAYRFV